MRLLRVYIDGYRNLKNVTVDFDKDSLTTVVIGENGTGKSNLIEAIMLVFRAYDLNQNRFSAFRFEIDYQINGLVIKLHNTHKADGQLMCSVVQEDAASYGIGSTAKPHLPDMIFGYYSGTGRKLERLFDIHQSRYYDVINKNRPRVEYQIARDNRRLFYCRSAHGVLALLSYLAKPRGDDGPGELLTESLGITGFHSALALLKQPSWFKEGQRAAMRETSNIWGAQGPAGECARLLRDSAFHALELDGTYVDDYRRAASKEAQLACFLRDEHALRRFAGNYKTDKEMFAALEAADISDLFREVTVWVTRKNDASGDISFSDLSDGERQLLMVLGLIRMARGKEVLFLLDEPDTHLNPAWQLTYLELIREWTEVAADEDTCQIVMTTHNPLTIAALEAKEVRVMSCEDDGSISVDPPRIDPRGLGFAGVLTDIFGLSSSLDRPTQVLIDRRNELAREEKLTDAMAKEFEEIKDELRHLGFLYEERDKLYSEFLKQLKNVELADVEPLSPDELREREAETRRIVEELLSKK